MRNFRRVELSLRLRRRRLLAALEDDEILPTVTTFPLMVCDSRNPKNPQILDPKPWTRSPKYLRERRVRRLLTALEDNEILPTVTTFPLMV